MKQFEEMVKGLFERGQGVIVTVGNSAKSTCKEALDLAKTEDELGNALFDLGLAVYNEYKEKPKAAAAKLFASELAQISELMATRDTLEVSLKQRFTKPTCTCCGAKLNPNHSFCPACGTEVEKAVEVEPEEEDYTCPECGEEYTEGQKFCGHCGTEL